MIRAFFTIGFRIGDAVLSTPHLVSDAPLDARCMRYTAAGLVGASAVVNANTGDKSPRIRGGVYGGLSKSPESRVSILNVG